MKTDVFISYASEDQETVLRIVEALQKSHIRCWIDNLTVSENSGPKIGYDDLDVVFADADTPKSDLMYQVVKNTNPDLVGSTIESA